MMEVISLANSNGMALEINNYGATMMSLKVPDQNNKLVNVVIGLQNPEDYTSPTYQKYGLFLGCSIGRYAGRIANGLFELEGEKYALDPSDQVHLHGGTKGFDKKYWNITSFKKGENPSVELSLLSEHMEGGYPGNLKTTVKYQLLESNSLKITYTACTDQTTVINLTNHAYYNLNGEGSISDNFLKLGSNNILELDKNKVPTGAILNRSQTSFDFIDGALVESKLSKGLDDVFVFKEKGEYASLFSGNTGIGMQVHASQPAMVVFTPEQIPPLKFKDGKQYSSFPGICFETQNYPDAPNNPNFPNCILRSDETYVNEITIDFSNSPLW